MENWTECKIVDLCQNVVSGGTPATSIREYYEGGTIPWLKTTEIHKEIIHQTDTFITEKGLKNSSAKLIPANSIIVAMYGDGGTAGKAALTKIALSTNQACCNLVIDPEKADYNFVYYYLKINYENLVSLKLGGSQQNLNTFTIKNFPIVVPDLPTQQRIAGILSAYDELIEVNNQRIRLLEDTARQLYKEWFVRLHFPGHEQTKFVKGLPDGWEVVPIGNVTDYSIGGGWGADSLDSEHTVPGYVIRGTDIPGIRVGSPNQSIYRFHKKSNMKSRELVPGDIVFENAGGSEGQPLGRTAFITQEILDAYGDKVMCASFCKLIRPSVHKGLYIYYFINALYESGQIETYQTQSTGISNYQFEPFLRFQQIIVPPDEVLNSFNDKIMPIQQQIANLGTQNTQLRQIRDRLLPRLISGKLSVGAVPSGAV